MSRYEMRGAPITKQPFVSETSLTTSKAVEGLEYLATVSELVIKQRMRKLQIITGLETNNKFIIKDNFGQKVFYVKEDNDCCTRICCGSNRPFDMKIFDNQSNNQFIHIYRPLACSSCCFPCCLQKMIVSAPPDRIIGTIEQKWSIIKPVFSIKNRRGETVLRIRGPFCKSSSFGDVQFDIFTMNNETQGSITKQWSGWLRETFSDADNFKLVFPPELDVSTKALVLAATFLIDMMFFEN